MFMDIFDLGFSIYDYKPGSKKWLDLLDGMTLRANEIQLYEMLAGMFDYERLPFRKEFIEEKLLCFGWCALGKDENGIHAGLCSFDDKDENGLPKGHATLTTNFGYQMDGEIGKDIIIGYNNDLRLPELMVKHYADMFNETDISIKSIIQKARLNPIPLVRDSKTEKAINEAMADIKRGNTKAIGYDGLKDDLMEGSEPVTMMHLTEPEHTDKLQYMSKFYDDMLRRFYTYYGHPLSSASKMAQVTSAELEGYSTMSRIYPDIMYKERKAFIEEVNAAFGTDISVDYSKPWQHLKNDIILNGEEVKEGNNDDLKEDIPGAEGSEQDSD